LAAPLRGYPADSSVTGYHHSAALARCRKWLLFRRTGLAGFAQTVAPQQEDLGVLDQAVRNRGRDGSVEQDVTPVGESCVRCNDGRTLVAMTGG